MLSLIGKDLRATALYLVLKVLVFGLFVIAALVAGRVFLVLSCVVAALLVVVAPSLDWSVGADAFVHSLPVSRRDVVRARYATSLLLAGGWLAIAALIAVIFASTVVAHGGAWPVWVALETALTALLYVSVFLAVFLASVFRFGVVGGGTITTMAMAVLAPVGIRVVTPADLAAMMRAVGVVPACAGVMLATAGIIWISMRISVRGYESREF